MSTKLHGIRSQKKNVILLGNFGTDYQTKRRPIFEDIVIVLEPQISNKYTLLLEFKACSASETARSP